MHAPWHVCVSAQRPVGHIVRELGTHAPAASHVGDGVIIPPAQIAVPQSAPAAIVQPCVSVVGSHDWHGFDGLRSPPMKHEPKIAHVSAAAVYVHVSVASSHVSVVQNAASSHGELVPDAQWSAPSHASPLVQKLPSLHGVPAAESGFMHVPALQMSSVHESGSTHDTHARPPPPHAAG